LGISWEMMLLVRKKFALSPHLSKLSQFLMFQKQWWKLHLALATEASLCSSVLMCLRKTGIWTHVKITFYTSFGCSRYVVKNMFLVVPSFSVIMVPLNKASGYPSSSSNATGYNNAFKIKTLTCWFVSPLTTQHQRSPTTLGQEFYWKLKIPYASSGSRFDWKELQSSF